MVLMPTIFGEKSSLKSDHLGTNSTGVGVTTTPASTLTFIEPKEIRKVIAQLYDYIQRPQERLCRKSVKVGGQADYRYRHLDGHKWVCLDPRLGMLDDKGDGCLVYSFGVDHDWSFDDNIQLLGCSVHAFDPSIAEQDHNRTSRIAFHNMGIAASDYTRISNGVQWKMHTYSSVVSMLNHNNRVVHYLKVDVEGAEWEMLAQVFSDSPQLLANVRQIGVEIHMPLNTKQQPSEKQWRTYLNTMIGLERAGFRLYHAEVNPYEPARKYFPWYLHAVSGVYELVWLKFT